MHVRVSEVRSDGDMHINKQSSIASAFCIMTYARQAIRPDSLTADNPSMQVLTHPRIYVLGGAIQEPSAATSRVINSRQMENYQ
ncbi:hypothetical protein EVAR_23977_1 [Eumeta japonica]|uniref:Uncharacterized protein n=1 Tax=Eumeta variegata TaxID=151549 RepID=A0A4C1V2W6_EUMVA|nr:hypothetical protein EVAR_23977_1 [Eumeta japonica]